MFVIEATDGELGAATGTVALGIEGVSGVVGSVGNDDGSTGAPGADCIPGIPGKENNSLAEGSVAVPG